MEEEFRKTKTEFIIKVPNETEMSKEDGFSGVNIGFCFVRQDNICSENKI